MKKIIVIGCSNKVVKESLEALATEFKILEELSKSASDSLELLNVSFINTKKQHSIIEYERNKYFDAPKNNFKRR